MNRREIVDYILELEQNYSVQTWEVQGVDIWPIIKRDIFFLWHNRERRKTEKVRDRRRTRSISLLLRSFIKFISLFIKRERQVDVAFCGAEFHRVVYKNKFVNRYYYPLVEKHIYKSYIEIEYSRKKENEQYENSEKIIFLDDFLPFVKLLNFFRPRLIVDIPELVTMVDSFSQILGISKDRYLKELSQKVSSVLNCILLFRLIFKKYQPKVSLGLCYYNLPMFAMHFVANEYRIENWDVQHGGQGKLHVMYTYASKSHFNILPMGFWCWDDTSKKNIASWIAGQNYHRAENKGNPWLTFQLKDAKFTFSQKKIILYTLQETFLEDYIIEAIKDSPIEFEWWLRLHPRMIDARAEIENILEKNKISQKTNITHACSYPLPVILSNSSLHISKYSGSIIEAALLGVKTIIVDPTGVDTYQDYVDSNDAIPFLEKDSKKLLEHIITMTN